MRQGENKSREEYAPSSGVFYTCLPTHERFCLCNKIGQENLRDKG